jgi:hypothetical protein
VQHTEPSMWQVRVVRKIPNYMADVECLHAVIFSQMMRFVKVEALKCWNSRQWNFLPFLSLLRFALTTEEFACASFYGLAPMLDCHAHSILECSTLFTPLVALCSFFKLCYLTCQHSLGIIGDQYAMPLAIISVFCNLRLVDCFSRSWHLLNRFMPCLQLLFILLVCNELQTVAEVMAFDRDRVASMIARDVSRTKRAPHSNFVILEVFC